MAEDSSSDVENACTAVIDAYRKQAYQDRGEEEVTPFIDTFPSEDVEKGKDVIDSVSNLTDTLFNTDNLNKEWEDVYNESTENGTNDGKEIRSRVGIAYLCAWKKALLKFYHSNSDIDAVYGTGLCFMNIGAQSAEATRILLSAPAAAEEPAEE